MRKLRLLAVLMIVILLASGCGGKVRSEGTRNNDNAKNYNLPENLEMYLGKTIEEFSEALGVEPEIDYQPDGENGYPELAFFSYKGDSLLYGSLDIDHFLSRFLDDSTLYISRIAVELPYKNIAGIQKGDDAKTVREKLSKAGLEYEDQGESIVYYYDNYLYSIEMFGEDNSADQIHIRKDYQKVDDKKFEAYCKALPGGIFLDNGDYMATTEKGLVQIYKNQTGYRFYDNQINGKLDKTDDGLFYRSDDGALNFSIDPTNGELALIQDNEPIPSVSPSKEPTEQNPLLTKYKDEVRLYQQYALEKWGYDTKRFYDVADFNNDGTLELYSIYNMSSPTPGTLQQSKLEIFTIRDGEVKFLDSYSAAEPMLQGGTEFTNYYRGSVPGEGDYFIIDQVNTRMGSGHSIRVGRITGTYQFEELDSVEFAYPNEDLVNGEMITDYPRAAELLAKYGVCYDHLLIGLDANYRLAFGYAYNEGDNSYDYFQQILSGDKDSEILYKLTGEWPE